MYMLEIHGMKTFGRVPELPVSATCRLDIGPFQKLVLVKCVLHPVGNSHSQCRIAHCHLPILVILPLDILSGNNFETLRID
jgi:hypothetical protein